MTQGRSGVRTKLIKTYVCTFAPAKALLSFADDHVPRSALQATLMRLQKFWT